MALLVASALIPGGSILSSAHAFSFINMSPNDPKKESRELSAAMKKPMEDLKKEMQALSNVLKTRHDTVKNSIGNIR